MVVARLQYGSTPLLYSVGKGEYSVVELLLEWGADMTPKAHSGQYSGQDAKSLAESRHDQKMLDLLNSVWLSH